VIAREAPDAVCETLLVIDATTGQNAVNSQGFSRSSALSRLGDHQVDGNAREALPSRSPTDPNAPGVGRTGEGLEDLTILTRRLCRRLLPADS
jgi:signal recognition particle GTPase